MMRLGALFGPVLLLVLALPPPAAGDVAGAGGAAGGPREAGVAARAEGAAGTEEPHRRQSGPVKADLDILTRVEAATDFSLADFAFTPGSDESRVLFRIRPALEWKPADVFRARLEGQWYAAYDERDFSHGSVYQAFVEASPPPFGAVALKAGRQEFVYGTTFMLGADTFYDGLSFDAVNLSARPPGTAHSFDAFGGRYVAANSGGIEGYLYGVYVVYAPRKTVSVDLYGFRDTGGAGATHAGGAHETTYSVGARVCGTLAGAVDVEVEPVWQFGHKNPGGSMREDIRAFGGHVDVALQRRTGRHPFRVFASYAYGSGDGNPADGTFREFHNPNNDTPLVGGMNVVGELGGLQVGGVAASGMRILSAGAAVDVTDKLNASLDGHLFRADRVPPGVSKDIGPETDLVLTYKVSDDLSVLLSADRFFTGGFFRDAAGSGRDIGYYFLQVLASL